MVVVAVRVYRYEVPVDDRVRELELSGDIVMVACRSRGVVELWAIAGVREPVSRLFQVFGTGHEVPPWATYVGTALDGGLVWHLFEHPNR